MLLQKRSNGIFYFRWVYPPALRKLLGKRELIKSLHTTSKSQALARAGVHYMAVEKLKAIYLSLSTDTSAWKKAFRAREDFFDRNPEGSDDIDQVSAVKQVLEECYDSDVPRYSRALLDLAEVYKPASLSDVQRKKELISSRLKLHREASTNLQGDGKKLGRPEATKTKALVQEQKAMKFSQSQIAAKLGLGIATVKRHWSV